MTATEEQRQSRRITGDVPATSIPKVPRDDERPQYLPVWALKMRQEYVGQIAELQRKVDEYEMSIVQQKQANMYLGSQPGAMALFGGENNIQALERQLMLSPKFKDLPQADREYIALLGLGMRLNPEFYIHAWRSKKRVKNPTTNKYETVEVLNVMLDYKALILLAKSERRVMLKDRRLTAEEMKARGVSERDIEEGSISYVVELFDLADAIMAKQAGIDYEPLRGYGFWEAKKDEERWSQQDNKYVSTGNRIQNDVANGRDGAFTSWKRALRALYYQTADMSLVFSPHPGMKQVDVVDEDVYQFVPDPEKTVEGQSAEKVTEEAAPTRWQDEPGRKEKAAGWMASLGVTDDMYRESTGRDWQTDDVSDGEFQIAVELLAKNKPIAAETEGVTVDGPAEPVTVAVLKSAESDLNTTTVLVEQSKPAPHVPPARNKPAAQPEASTDPETEGETEPPKVKDVGVAAPAPKMCKNCGLEPAVETPVGNDLCESCAKHSAK